MFGGVFGTFYGDATFVTESLPAEEMMRRVRRGAGMGMATFKQGDEDVVDEEDNEIHSLAGEPVSPKVMSEFLKARRGSSGQSTSVNGAPPNPGRG